MKIDNLLVLGRDFIQTFCRSFVRQIGRCTFLHRIAHRFCDCRRNFLGDAFARAAVLDGSLDGSWISRLVGRLQTAELLTHTAERILGDRLTADASGFSVLIDRAHRGGSSSSFDAGENGLSLWTA